MGKLKSIQTILRFLGLEDEVINSNINQHLFPLHLLAYLYDKYGEGDIKKHRCDSFYPAIFVKINMKNSRHRDFREYLYCYKRGNEAIVLEYLLGSIKQNCPYEEGKKGSNRPYIIVESNKYGYCSINIKEQAASLTNSSDKPWLECHISMINEILEFSTPLVK